MRIYQIVSNSLDRLLEDFGDPDQDQIDAPMGNELPDENQPDLPGGPQDDLPPGEDEYEPVDSTMMTALQGLPYMRKYEFKDDQPTNPVNIMGKDQGSLENLKNLVNHKMRLTQARNEPGMYAGGSDMEFYQDMYAFIEEVIKYKQQQGHSPMGDDIPQRAKELNQG